MCFKIKKREEEREVVVVERGVKKITGGGWGVIAYCQ